MLLDLRDVFAGGSDINIDTDLSFSDFEIGGINPVCELHFVGTIANKADVVSLVGKASFVYSALCDRCADEISRNMTFDIDHVIVNELVNEENEADDFIVVDNMMLDLDELIRSDIILNLPSKILCKPDCKGVCTGCGKRLNFEKCICKKEIDPRLSALSAFLTDDE